MQDVDLVVLVLFFALLALDIAILFVTWLVKRASKKRWRLREGYLKIVERALAGVEYPQTELSKGDRVRLLEAWGIMTRGVLPTQEARDWLYRISAGWGLKERADRLLGSMRFGRRAEGVRLLPAVPPGERAALIGKHLRKERNPLISLRLVAEALNTDPEASMDAILLCFRRQDAETRRRILAVLESAPVAPVAWALAQRDSADPDIRSVVLGAIASQPLPWTADFLGACLRDPTAEVSARATTLASRHCPELIDLDRVLSMGDQESISVAMGLLFPGDTVPPRERIRSLFESQATRGATVEALRRKTHGNSRNLDVFLEWYATAETATERDGWVEVLGTRAAYFFHRLEGRYGEKSAALIADMADRGFSAEVINFLNENRNPGREARLHTILRPVLDRNRVFRAQCGRFLNAGIQARWDIPEPEKVERVQRVFATLGERLGLAAVMVATILALPVSYVFGLIHVIGFLRPGEILSGFILHVQGVFLTYSVAISAVYLILMVLSQGGLKRQRQEWSLADRTLLHTPGILPPVSIIVPAYNEELTIVQSVHSLLGLHYPEYEVIVVNDGSTDGTFRAMIESFGMKRVDGGTKFPIETAPVTGVYRSSSEPNLFFIDKLNGGKADSLNAGIGLARHPYVCTIDADSLLEPETLLRMLFRTIVTKREVVACGGNVIPVNGCETLKGTLVGIHFPENRYARYQTIEYLRSFIAGRLGWVRLRGLIIISGALGVFSRRRVLEVGGYLTGRTPLGRDTVGEDFEIVIRLTRQMWEQRAPFLVDYAHNANCWTEVPDNQDDLISQRDRWHRGLMENMIFHRKLLFNPRYGQTGLLAIPYYVLFELIGPFIESLGYLIMFAAFFFGLLPPSSVILLFAVIVLLGLLVSTAALLLSERGVVYFQGKEFRKIIAYCFLENLGYRQFMGLLRPLSFAGFLLKNRGWSKFGRRGFSPRRTADASRPAEAKR